MYSFSFLVKKYRFKEVLTLDKRKEKNKIMDITLHVLRAPQRSTQVYPSAAGRRFKDHSNRTCFRVRGFVGHGPSFAEEVFD